MKSAQLKIASYIIEKKATVRQTAKKFGISKSTVHKDVTDRLIQINPDLAARARKVLDVNKSERHIPGRTGHQRKNTVIRATDGLPGRNL